MRLFSKISTPLILRHWCHITNVTSHWPIHHIIDRDWITSGNTRTWHHQTQLSYLYPYGRASFGRCLYITLPSLLRIRQNHLGTFTLYDSTVLSYTLPTTWISRRAEQHICLVTVYERRWDGAYDIMQAMRQGPWRRSTYGVMCSAYVMRIHQEVIWLANYIDKQSRVWDTSKLRDQPMIGCI